MNQHTNTIREALEAHADIGLRADKALAALDALEQARANLEAENKRLREALKLCAVLVHGGNKQGDAAIEAARAALKETP